MLKQKAAGSGAACGTSTQAQPSQSMNQQTGKYKRNSVIYFLYVCMYMSYVDCNFIFVENHVYKHCLLHVLITNI